jgi:hypothetical protein
VPSLDKDMPLAEIVPKLNKSWPLTNYGMPPPKFGLTQRKFTVPSSKDDVKMPIKGMPLLKKGLPS